MKLLSERDEFTPLLGQINQLNQLFACIHEALPGELADSFQAVAWSGKTLLLGVSSSAAAVRIRFIATQLLATLHKKGWQADAIHPCVQVSLQRMKPQKKYLVMPSSALSAFSDLVPKISDFSLKGAILKLIDQHAQAKK